MSVHLFPTVIGKAAVGWKLGHCYFLCEFFGALCGNHYYFGKIFFPIKRKQGVNNCFKPLIVSVFTTVASKLKSEQKKRKNESWN